MYFHAVEEFSVATRDGNKDNVRENAFGGGSPQSVVLADTDGDGKLEAACFSWNNHVLFFIEATGANAYAFTDTSATSSGAFLCPNSISLFPVQGNP